VVPFAWRGLWDVAGFLRVLRLCERIAPAILHCHDSKAFTLGSLVGRIGRIPVVTTRRVAFPIRPTAFNRWKFRRAAAVVAISMAVAEIVARVASRSRIVLVPDGVSPEGPILPRSEARRELGLPAEGRVIGTVGYFTREKNLPLMFRLAEAMGNETPPAVVACIGPMDDGATKRAASSKHLMATGPVPDASRYYAALDVYVSPSTSEGLGTSLLDAVVRDIPAVAYDAGGTRDVYPTGAAWLVPCGDEVAMVETVRAVIRDLDPARQTARAYGTRARSLFSVSGMVDGNAAVYRRVLSPAERPDPVPDQLS
jgi:glycosyltransferase involved in cell wall biosynthesis